MGRLLRYLIMFGPMLFRMYKKFTANKQVSNQNLPQRQDDYTRNQNTSNRMEGKQKEDGKWEFDEGQNPLG